MIISSNFTSHSKHPNTLYLLWKFAAAVIFSLTSENVGSLKKMLHAISLGKSYSVSTIAIKSKFYIETSSSIISYSLHREQSKSATLECRNKSQNGAKLCLNNVALLHTSHPKYLKTRDTKVSNPMFGLPVLFSTPCCMELFLSKLQTSKNCTNKL